MLNVLLIEDDFMIAQSIQQLLELEGMRVQWVSNGIEGLQYLSNHSMDIILLDIGLPSMNGFEVLNRIRAKSDIAVIVISARDSVGDRLNILKHGGDDYLTKPFDFDELIARIYAVLRRTKSKTTVEISILSYKELSLDLHEHQALWHDLPVDLSKKEWILMECFLNTPFKIFSKSELEEKIYSHDGDINSNTIEVYIHKLRQKLRKDFIKTIRGFGYRLE